MTARLVQRHAFSSMLAELTFLRAVGVAAKSVAAQPTQKSRIRFLMLLAVTAALVFSTSVEVRATVPGTPTLVRHYDLRPFSLQFFKSNMQMGDLNNDGLIDYLVYSNSRRMAAFADNGSGGLIELWTHSYDGVIEPAEKYQNKFVIWDIDDDGQTEVIGPFATASGYYEIQIRDGNTGAIERSIQTTVPNRSHSDPNSKLSQRCYVTVANFRGLATPQDIVFLSEKNSRGDIWVYTDTLTPLWNTVDGDEFIHAHYPWTYDIDGDGKDELVGKYLIDDDGTFGPYIIDNNGVSLGARHIDRAYIGELDSSNPGVDILVSQEYYEARMLDASGNLVWEVPRDHKDNKIIVAGEFSASDAGPEVVTYNAHDTVSLRRNDTYRCEDGTEIVTLPIVDDTASFMIDWDGDRTKDEAYKPKRGGFLWDPMDGDTIDIRNDYYKLDRFTANPASSRASGHVADVYGDNREEVIVCDDDEILVYTNADSNPNPRPLPWVSSDVYALLIANQMNDNHPERAFWPRATDLDGDGFIGWGDVAVISGNWLKTGADIVKGDLNGDEIVNFLDFAEFATDW